MIEARASVVTLNRELVSQEATMQLDSTEKKKRLEQTCVIEIKGGILSRRDRFEVMDERF